MPNGKPDSSGNDSRYLRHTAIDGFDQSVVAGARVLVVGAGAIGNEVMKNLALLGVGYIDVVDFDTIETHNLTRSVLFREHDIGESKASVAARRASELDPNVQVNGLDGDLWRVVSLSELASYSVCVACVDNFEARLRLNTMCSIVGVNFVSCGIDSRYASVQRHPFAEGADVACYECDLPAGVYSAMARRYSCGWLRKVSLEENKIPTTAITASAAGSLAVAWALAAISDSDEHRAAARSLFDTRAGRSTASTLIRNPECPNCSSIKRPVSVSTSPRSNLVEALAARGAQPDAEVTLSEPIIVEAVCVNDPDHTRDLAESVRWQPASDWTDAITHCTLCDDSSIRVDIVESLSMSQIEAAGSDLNCKFLRLPDGHVIELS